MYINNIKNKFHMEKIYYHKLENETVTSEENKKIGKVVDLKEFKKSQLIKKVNELKNTCETYMRILVNSGIIKGEIEKEFRDIIFHLNGVFSELLNFLQKIKILEGKTPQNVTKRDLLTLSQTLREQIAEGETTDDTWSAISIAAAIMKLQHGIELFESQEVQELYNIIKKNNENNKETKIKNILDLGCGNGRNSLFLNSKELNITSLDQNEDSIFNLNNIINQERLTNIKTNQYDINTASITQQYDTIISTVVFMFLNPEKINEIIKNIQQNTNVGGYNLFVVAMDTKKLPCVMPFSSPFKENQLKNYYNNKNWEIIKYNENPGELHKTDENGNRIKLQFATIIVKKLK